MLWLLVFLSPLLLTSCVTFTGVAADDPAKVYFPAEEENLLARFAPLFVLQTYKENYNRIGRPSARFVKKETRQKEIFIDPAEAAMFVEQRTFSTAEGNYTNLIYRIHFAGVPFNLIPFHVTAGKNPGLFVIVTLNSKNQPLLLTTVHTCGCYCMITPSSYLPRRAFPDGWQQTEGKLWGETLPAMIDYADGSGEKRRLLVFLRDGPHRVMHLQIMEEGEIMRNYDPLPIPLEPMAALKTIPLEDGSVTSFFEEGGWRNGYVKGSYKPWEMLLISWWALDLNVGCDKEYGDPLTAENRFYTSLKPWCRSESDMRNFAEFLHFWGWKL
ncbi:MAG: hypothetical protein E4H46_01470 [Desulfobacterales bacterium]|nr:MAG: hypothetical protein E4H46_01470 [Desulfobacterales bacterium]